ncbi:MAG: helix-turn-helix domain-containing protein [Pyrinomonadaceae bacterium MAG19_C2-C3]|nr:helix-turn-helix domain-containing protein [Pyrinomonadaceae bacterium MAG19_C2-C3]
MTRKSQPKSDQQTVDLDDLITQAEAARLRGVTRSAIQGLVQRGRLRSVEKFGRQLVYRSEVTAFEKDKPGPKKIDGDD